MYTFLLCASVSQNTQHQLGNSASVTERFMPTLGRELCTTRQDLPEIGGGWWTIRPRRHFPHSFIHEHVTDDHAVLVYGGLRGPGNKQAAVEVLRSWNEGGVDAVRDLCGAFSAVIVDRRKGFICVITDVAAYRAVRYVELAETLLVSPHDVPLVATGLCPLEFDIETAASITALDWSVGGAGLLKAVRTSKAYQVIHWQNGKTDIVVKPQLSFDARISAKNNEDCRKALGELVEIMQVDCYSLFQEEPRIALDLSAGMDTRATLAIALSVVEKSRISTRTFGGPDSLDARMAKRIAAHYDIVNTRENMLTFEDHDFLENCDVLAFYLNGVASCKSATYQPFEHELDSPVELAGSGGGIYKGIYYRPFDPHSLEMLSLAQMREVIIDKRSHINSTRWRSHELRAAVIARLDRVLEEISRLSSHPADILDLFYLLERYARWNHNERVGWGAVRYSLLTNPTVVRRAFLLPVPLGRAFQLHREVIGTLMPWAHWLTVNTSYILPLSSHRIAQRVALAIRHRRDKVSRILGRSLRKEDALNKEQIFSEYLRSLLQSSIRDLLEENNSFATEVLGSENLRRMIDEHVAGLGDNANVLGQFVIMERWRQLVTAAKSSSQKNS